MPNEGGLSQTLTFRSPAEGWLGTPEQPGYRAGNVVARLADWPNVDPEHLYFNLLLLDEGGELQDHHSGPCLVMSRQHAVEERACFVRLVAELVRYAPTRDRGLSAIGQALSYLRSSGVQTDCLVLAAQLLDEVCSEAAVVASLCHLLELALGVDEAPLTMSEVVLRLADVAGAPPVPPEQVNAAGLRAQVSYVVRTVGKARARRRLREWIDFQLVPSRDLLGL